MDSSEVYDQLITNLKKKGFRITVPRKAIIEVISQMEKPLTPVEIFERARPIYPRVGLTTVYRTIDILTSCGRLDHVHRLQGCEAVFLSPSSHQHLLICTKCGKAIYFDGLDVKDAFEEIERKFDFNITNHWFQVFGICSECKS
jgi:Fur family transcriptional regulator, ferric uptake regulator